MEAEAQSALSWAAQVVPGLSQTAAYARQVTSGYLERTDPVPPSETRRRVEVRLARQQVLRQTFRSSFVPCSTSLSYLGVSVIEL